MVPIGPDGYIGGPILSANIGTLQIYQYQHTVHQYLPILKKNLRLEKILGIVI